MNNIKNLPEGRKYWTEVGYSQTYPYVEVSRTAKTVTLAEIEVGPDPEWKPEIHPGGFAGHCSNQSKQTWVFVRFCDTPTRTIRFTKKGWAAHGNRFLEDTARYFYDYNF